jgi:cysteine dioxygenase
MSQINTLSKLFEIVQNGLKTKSSLKSLLKEVNNYTGTDWKEYVKINKKCYNRGIFKKNDIMELVIITWDIDQNTPKHGHPMGGCIYKVIQGNINEHFYENMKTNDYEIHKYKKDDSNYIDNSIGFHVMTNESKKVCVSLHIYSPPFNSCCS